MQSYYGVALVTILSGLVCFGMAVAVSRAHVKSGILPPAMTGDPVLERTIRAHSNTLEWMPLFLPALWMAALYWNPVWAAALGGLWIVGRIIYFFGYVSAPKNRFPGFFIQSLAFFVLSLGALGRIVYLTFNHGTAGAP